MSDSRAIDRESRRLIREELETNILVEAGAGSGKTQMLAERMAAGVAAGVYPLENLAAVTFTRKAASELRGRFHLALEAELSRARGETHADGAEHSARIARIESALSNLESFFAGTIHSFCARLLRERPVESGVAPGFTELDETQDFELRQRAWRDFITGARALGDPDMMALMAAEVRPKDLDAAFATICVNDDVDFPAGTAVCPDPKPAFKALEDFWKELQKHLPAKIPADTTCSIQNAARQFHGQMRVARYRLNRPSVVASLLDTWNFESKIVQKWWSDSAQEKKRLRDLIQGLHEEFRTSVVTPYLSQWRQYIYRLAVTLLTRARDSAAAERRRLNSLNYGDLLNLTARVLRENVPVRRALQEKFKYVLVDEFQDTDPVQAEIMFWLAEDGEAAPAAKRDEPPDWRKVALRPGALFVVGDPKQSIYRFRRADIDIYSLVRQRFSDHEVGKVLPLTLNFRSTPAICEWANEVFETRFPAEPTAYAPRFTALDAERADASGGVFTLSHNCDSSELQRQDAEKIAACIRTEVDAGRSQFSDFLILTRKKRDRIAPYAQALELLNIPMEVSGAGAFGKSGAIRTMTVLLRALADPQNQVALIAVLRGPLFGISDPELFAFKQEGGWFSLFHEFTEEKTGPLSTVQSALAAVQQYYRWTRVLPAAAALDRILEATGYLAMAATAPAGVDAGDLLHAVDRVRQLVQQGGSLADAADALEADSEPASELESLPLEPGRTDVVRLMNLHKAKGLEADVVFLADPGGGPRLWADVHIERTGLKATGWLKIVRKSEGSFAGKLIAQHADWPAHEAEELPYLRAEEDRLLYVAATRARRMLVVSRWKGKATHPAWGVLNDFLGQADELRVPSSVCISPREPLDCGTATEAAAESARSKLQQAEVQPSWAITSVTAEARQIARMTRSVEVVSDDPSKVVTVDTPAHRADAGQAWGTLIHGLLEHAMRHQDATASDLARLAMWLTVEEPQLRAVLDEAVSTVLEVSKAGFWENAVQGEHCEETPFTYNVGDGQIVSGVVDLMYKDRAAWHIVDYKTDLDLSEAGGKYAQQITMYEQALARVGIKGTTSQVYPVRLKSGGPE
ncbi:MAG: UvrD-helicase domain-containing protein [Candidatus Korobacteraceae bacterium]